MIILEKGPVRIYRVFRFYSTLSPLRTSDLKEIAKSTSTRIPGSAKDY